jgi:hypothetical protein
MSYCLIVGNIKPYGTFETIYYFLIVRGFPVNRPCRVGSRDTLITSTLGDNLIANNLMKEFLKINISTEFSILKKGCDPLFLPVNTRYIWCSSA